MVKIVAKIEGGSRLQQLIHDTGWVNMLQSTLSHQSIIVAFFNCCLFSQESGQSRFCAKKMAPNMQGSDKNNKKQMLDIRHTNWVNRIMPTISLSIFRDVVELASKMAQKVVVD